MVAHFLVTSYQAVISTGFVVSAGIAFSSLSAFPLATCVGGVIVPLGVGAQVRLWLSKSPTSTMPLTLMTSALRIQGGTSLSVGDFGSERRLLFTQWNGMHNEL